MPPFIRNPFSNKRSTLTSGLEPANDENIRPDSSDAFGSKGQPSKPSLALDMKGNREEPNEFKLSCEPLQAD